MVKKCLVERDTYTVALETKIKKIEEVSYEQNFKIDIDKRK
jgi:hypothetical protein